MRVGIQTEKGIQAPTKPAFFHGGLSSCETKGRIRSAAIVAFWDILGQPGIMAEGDFENTQIPNYPNTQTSKLPGAQALPRRGSCFKADPGNKPGATHGHKPVLYGTRLA
jgi:hypothetical protein